MEKVLPSFHYSPGDGERKKQTSIGVRCSRCYGKVPGHLAPDTFHKEERNFAKGNANVPHRWRRMRKHSDPGIFGHSYQHMYTGVGSPSKGVGLVFPLKGKTSS
jgi:hypothetical protein